MFWVLLILTWWKKWKKKKKKQHSSERWNVFCFFINFRQWNQIFDKFVVSWVASEMQGCQMKTWHSKNLIKSMQWWTLLTKKASQMSLDKQEKNVSCGDIDFWERDEVVDKVDVPRRAGAMQNRLIKKKKKWILLKFLIKKQNKKKNNWNVIKKCQK